MKTKTQPNEEYKYLFIIALWGHWRYRTASGSSNRPILPANNPWRPNLWSLQLLNCPFGNKLQLTWHSNPSRWLQNWFVLKERIKMNKNQFRRLFLNLFEISRLKKCTSKISILNRQENRPNIIMRGRNFERDSSADFFVKSVVTFKIETKIIIKNIQFNTGSTYSKRVKCDPKLQMIDFDTKGTKVYWRTLKRQFLGGDDIIFFDIWLAWNWSISKK